MNYCDALYCQKALVSYYNNYYNFVTLFFGCKGAMEDRVNPVFWLAMQVGLQYIACLGKLIPFCEWWIHLNG